MANTLWIIISIVVLIFIIYIYNSLISLRVRMKNSLAQIDVQLKRRYDLIPNLVKTVKGYMKHEKTVLENITKTRTSLITGSMKDKAKASNQITKALKSIFAVAENYPQLRASENFKLLQEELVGTESKIAYARQFYNDSVLEFNNSKQTFPNNMVAGMFGFTDKEFFEVEESARTAPKVSF